MTASSPVPTIRRMDFPFLSAGVPRHWFCGDRHLTRSADAMHLLFPAGERFFMRSVQHFGRQLEDPELKARVRGFVGQEAMHGREHREAFGLLERDGIEYQSFVDAFESTLMRREAVASPLMNLSVTCALEHLTATLGAQSFSDPFIQRAHPTMRDLMLWHAAEEVEHKSVAFDVYRAMGGGYAMRIAGMVLAYVLFMAWWQRGIRHLLEQDGGFRTTDMRALRRRMRAGGVNMVGDMRRAVVAYMRPSFHPDDDDNLHLATDYFAGRHQLAG